MPKHQKPAAGEALTGAVSLLWPADRKPKESLPRLNEQTVRDLDLGRTIENLCLDSRLDKNVETILLSLTADGEVIRHRQDVLDDLLSQPSLVRQLENIRSELSDLGGYQSSVEGEDLLYEVCWRLGELETYVDCVTQLSSILKQAGDGLRSAGLMRLKTRLEEVEENEVFQNLVGELPELLSRVRGIRSVTVGVNLDKHLRPFEATLLSVNRKSFRGSFGNLFGKIFGGGTEPVEKKPSTDGRGIAPLHSVPRRRDTESFEKSSRNDTVNPMLVPLFRDLANVLNRISEPIAAQLRKYVGVQSRFLVELASEISFFLGAVRLIDRIRAGGLPFCRPEISPGEDGICEVEESYNLNLALRMGGDGENLSESVVTNDIRFSPSECVFILTGPNRGGKTTYMQSVGLVHVLAQAGLYIPGSRGRISPVDGIYTHFPADEKPDLDTGRLGEEATRLSGIFSAATPRSLILLNESFATTSPKESLYLAREIVQVLLILGVRSIYTTHLHELSHELESLQDGDNPRAVSLVSLASEETGEAPDDPLERHARRTFKIVPGQPKGFSYATEIASRYGISFEQLVRRLKDRDLLT